MKKLKLFNWILFALGFVAVLLATDYAQVERDIYKTKQILLDTRMEAIKSGRPIMVEFCRNKIKVKELATGKTREFHFMPTLSRVRYDTTLGDDMIIFTPHGNDVFNIHLHGGDITFRNWFGKERSIWVNCTGYAREGLLEDWVLKE